MAVTRRAKRSTAGEPNVAIAATEASTTADTSSTPASKFSMFSPSNAMGMSPSQFSSLVCISIGMTHCLDVYRSVQEGESSTYCNRYFAYSPQIEDPAADPLQCTVGDLGIMQLKYQTTIMRIILYFITMMLCWGKEPLLRSWNIATAISPLGTSIVGMVMQKDYLLAPEKFSLFALLVLCFTSNREGRGEKIRMNLKEGLYNIALFLLTSIMSYFVSNHLILGVESYTVFSSDADGDKAVSEGGKALWFMMIVVEYSSFMFASTFALFYFDESRKRVFLACLSMLALVHAFYLLPLQKDIWEDPSGRQTASMGFFFVFVAAALIPSFDKIVIKK